MLHHCTMSNENLFMKMPYKLVFWVRSQIGASIKDLMNAVLLDEPEYSLIHLQAHAHNEIKSRKQIK